MVIFHSICIVHCHRLRMVAPIFAETSVLSNNQATIKGQQKPTEFQETMANHEKTFFFIKHGLFWNPCPQMCRTCTDLICALNSPGGLEVAEEAEAHHIDLR